jgi:hypothetical protein
MNGFVALFVSVYMRIQWEKTTLYQETSSVNTLTMCACFFFFADTKACELLLLFLLLPLLHYESPLLIYANIHMAAVQQSRMQMVVLSRETTRLEYYLFHLSWL